MFSVSQGAIIHGRRGAGGGGGNLGQGVDKESGGRVWKRKGATNDFITAWQEYRCAHLVQKLSASVATLVGAPTSIVPEVRARAPPGRLLRQILTQGGQERPPSRRLGFRCRLGGLPGRGKLPLATTLPPCAMRCCAERKYWILHHHTAQGYVYGSCDLRSADPQ